MEGLRFIDIGDIRGFVGYFGRFDSLEGFYDDLEGLRRLTARGSELSICYVVRLRSIDIYDIMGLEW